MAAPNPQIPIEARQTVLDMIVANQSFTAYEITLEVRRRLGTTVEVPHPVVNPVVQTMFAQGEIIGYTRAPDATVNAANPPFRYSPQGAPMTVAAPVVVAPAPAASAINRANLPNALRFSDPVRAIMREYGLEARDFHIAAGTPDLPFDVSLPDNARRLFAIRSYGVGLSDAEVIARYSLSPSTRFDGGPIPQTAFAYADRFDIHSFKNGVVTMFLASLDASLQGTVIKVAQGATTDPDGLQISVECASADMSRFRGSSWLYSRFRVKPKGVLAGASPTQALAQGNGWAVLPSGNGSVAIVDDVGYSIKEFLTKDCGLTQAANGLQETVEFHLPVGSVDIALNRDSLIFSARTKSTLSAFFQRMIEEYGRNFQNQFSLASNIWEAKQVYARAFRQNRTSQRLQTFVSAQVNWQGIPIENEQFDLSSNPDVTVRVAQRRPYSNSGIHTYRCYVLTATENSVIVFNDLSTRTGSPARIKQFFEDNPSVQNIYVFTFVSDAVKDKFIADNHFESVPVRRLSTLPKPASTATVRTSAKTPFDAGKHFEQRPDNALVAAYFDGHADFDALELWARSVAFDKAGWPDFKRLYKHIELRVWPIPTRSRWKKSEADLPPDSPTPGERELIALGLLIARLAETDERDMRNRRLNPASTGGPTRATLAYTLRRAVRLVEFLRDRADLSAARRAWLAPLAAGMLQRPRGLVFAAQHNLLDGEELAARPDLIEGLWNDTTLPIAVLKWAHAWLQARKIEARATPARIQVLLGQADGFELALRLAPPLLESGALWPANYSLEDLARALESAGDNASFGSQVLALFARFGQLRASDEWLRAALGEVAQADAGVFEWAANWVRTRAQNSDFALVPRLSAPLQDVFNAELMAAFASGLSADQWGVLIELQSASQFPLAPSMLLSALSQLPLSPEIAVLLWSLSTSLRAEWIGALGQTNFDEAFGATIEIRAKQSDFAFALSLSPSQQSLFFDALTSDADGLDLAGWQQLGALGSSLDVLALGLARLPLGEGFWTFFVALPVEERAPWLERIGIARASTAFQGRSASEVAALLDGNTQGIEPLVDAWIAANLARLSGDEELILRLATSDNAAWRVAALAQLGSRSLSLRVALRLIESGLPEAQTLARGFFAEDVPDWSARVLALCDSPARLAMREALELLARFPARWTPELLTQLAGHDDPLVQSFVAARLSQAPQSNAVVAFERALLNARGRSRRAKNSVQERLNQAPPTDAALLQSLLDAARNGAPRDRAWALGQLVRLKMTGADVGELQLGGAVVRAAGHD